MQTALRLFKWLLGLAAVLVLVLALIAFLGVRAFISAPEEEFGTLEDEAKRAGMTAANFPGADEPYYTAMDKGLLQEPQGDFPKEIQEVAEDLNLPPEAVRQAAIRGQNMWNVWTGGNDKFWDTAAQIAYGSFDLLKILSSHPDQGYSHDTRFRYLGLMNEPCFEKATAPNPERFGLWLDSRGDDCAADPFANPEKYPGAKLGQRGQPMPEGFAKEYAASLDEGRLPVGSHYGEPSGIMGLRLFPNPDFDEDAAAHWDPERFYTDPDYYNDGKLVRPYRVGMSCAFCHVGPNPINPPADVEAPQYSEMTSNPGAQYYWVDRIFYWNTRAREAEGQPAPNEGSFLFQLFHTNPPGALDTSLVSTDYMNNPRTMNAVYETRARLLQSLHSGIETLSGGELDNKQFQDFAAGAELSAFFDPETGKSASMRVLKDGADSVGTLGALNRVYLNIGLFSEEWLLHFRPFLGGQKISPIEIATAQKNSVYWQATEQESINMAAFFLVTGRADRLEDAPGGTEILAQDDPEEVTRGMEVFAETCAACHSSKQPAPDPEYQVDMGVCEGGGAGPQYLECWGRYWEWAQSDSFKSQMLDLVKQDGFLDGNYLSTERRVPKDLLGTNACTPTATNGLRGDIWDNFTSDTYKSLPPVGEVTLNHPVSGAAFGWQALGNGRGYLRPASLVSVWSSAPYLSNNSLGYEPQYYGREDYGGGQYAKSCPAADPYDPNMPCVENRVYAFEAAMAKLLDPSLRRRDTLTTEPVPGYIYRTSAPSCLTVPPKFLPDALQNWSGLAHRLAPWAVDEAGGIALGPFPEGFPVNALVNTKLLPDNDDPDMLGTLLGLAKAGPGLLGAFKELGGQCSPEELADPGIMARAAETLRERGTIDTLVGLSKCPDYVVNRGHEFGKDLSAEDRAALTAYLKRF